MARVKGYASNLSARSIIAGLMGKSVYPVLLKVGKLDRRVAYELRYNKIAENDVEVFHVTVAYAQDDMRVRLMSNKCATFNSYTSAINYISSLKYEWVLTGRVVGVGTREDLTSNNNRMDTLANKREYLENDRSVYDLRIERRKVRYNAQDL